MAIKNLCWNFEFVLVTLAYLISETSTEPNYGYIYQKPRIPFDPYNSKYSINQQYDIINNFNRNPRNLINFNNNIQHRNFLRWNGNTDAIGNSQIRQAKSYNHNNGGWQSNLNYGNLYESMKTSYDVPLFSTQHINEPSKNYDPSEYKQILNDIYHNQYQLPITNGYGNKIDVTPTNHHNILDANVLKIIQDFLLKDEIKMEEERLRKRGGKPHPIYGVSPPKIVGVKLDPPVRSILVKESTIHG